MKRKPLILSLFLLLFSVFSFGQTFSWNDKDFTIGSKRVIHIVYDLDGGRPMQESYPILDTVARFLKNNPYLKIEIANHTDQQGSMGHNKPLSQRRAQSCVNCLIYRGVDSSRVKAKGYWYSEAIIPMSKIMQMKTIRAKDSAYAINRRTEVRIISTCYGHETFNWIDKIFFVGSKRKIRIMWDLDTGGLGQDAKDSLDIIVAFLKINPGLKIEIASHTDQQGSLAHNKILSQARSQSMFNYLISQGIDSARLVPKGYWDSEPIVPTYQIGLMKTKQEKDAAYAINRRTEIRIIGKLP